MSEEKRKHRHEEKAEEKEEEKRHEKEEKNWDEKWQHNPVRAVMWAAIFIWGGLVLLLSNMHVWVDYNWWDTWGIIFAGAGVIVILTAFYRLRIPEHRRPVTGMVIIGLVLLAVGLGDVIGWKFVWPIVLIALGVFIMARGLSRRQG